MHGVNHGRHRERSGNNLPKELLARARTTNLRHNRGVITQREFAKLVERTISALEGARLPLAMPGAAEMSEARVQLLTQLRTRVLPKLRQRETPAVIVFGGSSGAGKSTLFNSLLGEELSEASVLRPTTRTPVIAVHPDDESAVREHALLEMGKVVVTEGVPRGTIVIDAPDLDSIDADNREVSRRLLDAADLWIFVTTAARYGDSIAWDILTEASRRGTTIAVVLNRVGEKALENIRLDLVGRLEEAGLGNSPLLAVADAGPHEGILSASYVEELRELFTTIGGAGYGQALVDRSNASMFPQIGNTLEELSAAVETQALMVDSLREAAQEAARATREQLVSLASHGRFGQGAPTTAWISHASAGGALAPVAGKNAPGFLQRRRTAQRDVAVAEVNQGIVKAIRTALSRALISASSDITSAWRGGVADTTQVIADAEQRISFESTTRAALGRWDVALRDLVRRHGVAWFSDEGTAALFGAAAGGVSGAVALTNEATEGQVVRTGRERLAQILGEAIDEVVEGFCAALGTVSIGNGRELRLRAAEFKRRF